MKKFVVTARARRDLTAIWRYIAQETSIETADRVLSEFYDAIQMLAHLPGMGHSRRDVTSERYRFWNVYRYVIAYRIDRSPLTIARVVHGSRNFNAMFR